MGDESQRNNCDGPKAMEDENGVVTKNPYDIMKIKSTAILRFSRNNNNNNNTTNLNGERNKPCPQNYFVTLDSNCLFLSFSFQPVT